MMTHEAGAGPKQNRTETINPSDACALLAALPPPHEAAIPSAIKNSTVDRLTIDVDGAAAEVCCEDPREHDHDPLEGRSDETKCKCGVVSHASL